jgi:hypothetical protein
LSTAAPTATESKALVLTPLTLQMAVLFSCLIPQLGCVEKERTWPSQKYQMMDPFSILETLSMSAKMAEPLTQHHHALT